MRLARTITTAAPWMLLELLDVLDERFLLLKHAKLIVPVDGHPLEGVGIALVVPFLHK